MRVEGIKDVIRLAMKMDYPVFVGREAFEECAKGFMVLPCHHPQYICLHWQNIKIILCDRLQSKNFFTCSASSFTYDWHFHEELIH